MTITAQTKLLLAALQAELKVPGGRAFVASDVLDCIEQLRMKPGVESAAILWVGEMPREGQLDVLGRVDRLFKVVVSRGRSMKLQPGESLTEGAAGGRPMFEVFEEVRAAVLALRLPEEDNFDGAELIPVYLGSGQFEVNGMLLDAVEVRFQLAAQIPVQQGG